MSATYRAVTLDGGYRVSAAFRGSPMGLDEAAEYGPYTQAVAEHLAARPKTRVAWASDSGAAESAPAPKGRRPLPKGAWIVNHDKRQATPYYQPDSWCVLALLTLSAPAFPPAGAWVGDRLSIAAEPPAWCERLSVSFPKD